MFWKYEYCKHGTCCQHIPAGPGPYFEKTMELYDAITKNLTAAGVNSNGTHKFSVLNQALVQTATYKCETKGDVQYLKELGVCYDNKTFARKACPNAEQCDNGETFYLPPKPSPAADSSGTVKQLMNKTLLMVVIFKVFGALEFN